MDGLALLCTLHADGPATLKRLRGAGCSDLDAVLARPTEELARLLDLTPASARRLRREAGMLRERVSGGFLQEEETVLSTAAAAEEADAGESELSGVDRAILGRVLETWRERDAAELARDRGDDPLAATPVDPVDDGESHVSIQALEPGISSGLDAERIARLAEIGIRSLQEFVSAEATGLAHELGLPFSELRRMQFLAARATGAGELVPKTSRAARPSPPGVLGDAPFGAGIGASGAPAEVASARERSRPQWNFEIPRRETASVADPEASGGPFA